MQTPNLDLATRSSLPDSIAHLRSGYPRDAWRFHPNFGSLTTFWLNLHARLRRESASVAEQLRTAQADPLAPFDAHYVPALNGFLSHLDMHHRIEDAQLFPGFRRADPAAFAAVDILETDHHLIEEGIGRTVTTGRALLATQPGTQDVRRRALDAHAESFTSLARMLGRHLADEEEIIVPAMLIYGQRLLS